MMMECNSPTTNQQRVSNPPSPGFGSPSKLDDSLASISHMIGLSPGIVRPLCQEPKCTENMFPFPNNKIDNKISFSNQTPALNAPTNNTMSTSIDPIMMQKQNQIVNNTQALMNQHPQQQQHHQIQHINQPHSQQAQLIQQPQMQSSPCQPSVDDGNDYWRRMQGTGTSTPPRSPVPVTRIGSANNIMRNNSNPSLPMTPTKMNSPIQSNRNMYHYNPSPQKPMGYQAPEKPPYSFPCLIGLALTSIEDGRMSVSQIYDYVTSRFPYFKTAKAGWKNSVRHNLSLNKFFCKLERRENEAGKGSMWGIVPENKEQLLRDIAACKNRYPNHRVTSLQMPSTPPPKSHVHHPHTPYPNNATPPIKSQTPQPPNTAPFLTNRTNSAPAFKNVPLMKVEENDTFNQQHMFNNPRFNKPRTNPSLWGSPAARRLSLPADIPIVMEEDLGALDVDDILSNHGDLLNEEATNILNDENTMTTWIGGGPSPGADSTHSLALDMNTDWQNFLPEDLSSYIGGNNVFNDDNDFFNDCKMEI